MSESSPTTSDEQTREGKLRAAPVADLLRDPQIVTGLGGILAELDSFQTGAAAQTDPDGQPEPMKCVGEPSVTPSGQFVAGFEQGTTHVVFVFNLSELRSPDFTLRPIEINPSPFATITFRDGSDTVEVQGNLADGNEVMVHMANPLDWELDSDGKGIGITVESNGVYEHAEQLAELGQLVGVELPPHTIHNESTRK